MAPKTPVAPENTVSDVKFLTVAEIATVTRLSKMTIYRLIHSGELESIRVGRSFRVPEQVFEGYLRRRGLRAGQVRAVLRDG